jgi:hypothetical protein
MALIVAQRRGGHDDHDQQFPVISIDAEGHFGDSGVIVRRYYGQDRNEETLRPYSPRRSHQAESFHIEEFNFVKIEDKWHFVEGNNQLAILTNDSQEIAKKFLDGTLFKNFCRAYDDGE